MTDLHALYYALLAVVSDDDWTHVLHPAWFRADTDVDALYALAVKYGVSETEAA